MIMVWNNWCTSLLEKKSTFDLLLTSLPGQFKDIHSPDKLSDHDIVAGTLKVVIPPIKKPRRKHSELLGQFRESDLGCNTQYSMMT